MTRILWKEAADLAPLALVAAVAAVLLASVLGSTESFPLPGLALLCAGCGAAMGVTQGLFDRRRRDDPFLLHRPLSGVRIHAARGAVGTALSAALAAVAAIRLDLTPFRRAGTGTWTLPGAPTELLTRIDPGLSGSLACIAGAVVLHAVVRLALTPRRPFAAAAFLVVLPTMVLYALLSVETGFAPWLLFAAIAGAASALAALQLAARPA